MHMSYRYIYTYDFSKEKKSILNKDEWKALNDLRKDDSIIITKPGKGNGIVILNKLDYMNKMNILFIFSSPSPLISSQSRTRLVLPIGPRRINITMR